ncbi:LIM and SH3 domain protein F42H10.3-like isoform X5 [Argopecten irradians]|uniref:LIM and SH3 domain protein F42H10.3-like isoform X5 n=1 Tax=Argopecten irradians TaxID=31199 RepID=UPI0037215510
MSKQCAKCTKTVFPVEELKCLDKVWHKGCFRCQECNMSLNMKNYKGYNKLPYCNAHYPKTTHTVVAETPETRRIAENTKIQSNVQYHSDFERSKGAYTQVPDTVDMKRLLLNTQNISAIQYHKDFEMSKDQFTPVVDTPDLKRVRDNTKNISLIEYQKEFTSQRGSCKQISDTVEMRTHSRNTDNFSTVKYHAEFEKSKGAKISIADDPETKRVRKNMETISNISYHGDLQKRNQMEMNRPVEQDDHVSRRRPGSTGDYEPRGRQPGSINDYDPTANQGGTPYSQRQSQGTAVYDSRTGVVYENPMAYQGGNYQYQGSNAPQQAPQQQGGSAPGYAVWQPPSTRVDHHQRYSTGSSSSIQNGSHGRKVGSISDYDPVNEKYGSIAGQYSEPSTTYTPPVTSDEEPPQTTPKPVPTAEEQIDTTVPISSADSSAEKDAISAQEEDPKMEIHFATPVRMTQTNQIPSMINNLPPTYAPPAPPTEEAASPSDDCLPSYDPPAPPSYDPPTSPNEETISQSNDCPPQYDPPPPPTEEVMDRSEDFSSPEDLAGSSQPQQARQPAYQPPPQQQQQQPYRPPGQPQRNQVKYKAMYDYTAADDDEVSFREDDYIVNCEIIDAGWMEGTVERTGQRGMLPSNYVEKCS